METEKRKWPENDDAPRGKRAKAGEEKGGERATEEEEVEEFFAILQRIQVAIKYFEKGKGERRELTAKGSRWRPSFEWEDFEGVNGVKESEKAEEGGEENAGLDLNADPETEGNSVSV
ncbi:hypothetical protein L1049_005878 [Liquidambar formosana]|uniref:Uncharacterized protein n=1 Tax=Liquidambar formosana TaxID=63359 RepID=A0AAP0RGM7_LIQFO